MTLGQLEAMMKVHDLTYDYSDDGRHVRAGRESFQAIKEASKEFPVEVIRSIWNKIVDKKIVEGHREPFYWKDAWSK